MGIAPKYHGKRVGRIVKRLQANHPKELRGRD
jgi:hypothetical protein